MIPPVYQTLMAAPAVTAIAGDRIHGSGYSTQGTDQPYIVWFTMITPYNTLSCPPDSFSNRVQIDCYSRIEPQARQLFEAVMGAIEEFADMNFAMPEYEDKTGLYKWTLDFGWIVSR